MESVLNDMAASPYVAASVCEQAQAVLTGVISSINTVASEAQKASNTNVVQQPATKRPAIDEAAGEANHRRVSTKTPAANTTYSNVHTEHIDVAVSDSSVAGVADEGTHAQNQ